MILRFTAAMDYLALNTVNKVYTMSKRIVTEYDEVRKFLPHVNELSFKSDLWNIKAELDMSGYMETEMSSIFYDGNDTCTEFVTDDLPFN